MKPKILLYFFALPLLTQLVNAQPNYVPNGGLRAYWPFNLQNTANDIGPSGYVSTLYPTIGVQPALVNNRFGNSNDAYNFNGSNWIETPFSGILGDSARAVAFWAKTPGSGGVGMYPIGWGSNNLGDRFGCGLDLPANQAFAGGGNCIQPYNTTSPTSNNAWRHYVFQFSSTYGNEFSHVRVWQDAVQIFTTSVGTYNANQILYTIGNFNVTFGKIIYSSAPAHYTGDLDEIGIWNRVLSQCEISNLYYANLAIGSMSFNPSGYLGAVNNLAQYTQTVTGNNQFSSSIVSSSYSGTGVSFNAGQYNFNSPPTLANGNYVIAHTFTLQGGCVKTYTQSIKVIREVGLNEINKTQSFNIELFPNPSHGNITITSNLENENLSIRIVNLTGSIVHQTTINSNTVNSIDISFLPESIYFIEVQNSENKLARKKFLQTK